MDTLTPLLKKSKYVQETEIPALQNGDHLTRVEFERRYAAHPHIKKAELIEGVVYVLSPVSLVHSHRHANVILWLGTYLAATPGLRLLDNATVILDAENEVQPDAALYIIEGGQARPVRSYLHGAPALVVEIAGSSAAYDLHEKMRVYRRTGVMEYIVMLALEGETQWYRLNEGQYELVAADESGTIRSAIFPGLYFHPDRFWADDLSGLLKVLQTGLSTSEHAEYVARLTAS